MKGKHTFIVLAVACILLSLSLVYKIALPSSYVLLSILIGIILAVSFYYVSLINKWFILSVFVTAVLLLNVYNLSTGFTTVPFYDGYKEIVASKLFIEEGKVFFIEGNSALEHASTYPIPQIFFVIFSQIINLDAVQSALILPSLYGSVMFFFLILFVGLLVKIFHLPKKLLFLSLLLFITSSDAIYAGMVYYSRFYSLSLFFIVLYFLLKLVCAGLRRGVVFIVSLLLGILPFSYSIFPFYLLFIIVSLYTTSRFVPLINRKQKVDAHAHRRAASSGYVVLIGLMSFIFSNVIFHTYFLKSLHYGIKYFINFLAGEVPLRTGVGGVYYIPDVLVSETAAYTIQVRDLLLYLPAAAGFIVFLLLLIKGRFSRSASSFLVHVIVSLVVLFVVSGLLNFAAIGVRYPSLYLLVFFATLSYGFLVRNLFDKKIPKIVITLLIIFLVSTAFLSLWSHRYFPLHVYDSSIGFKEAGEHNPLYFYVEPFVNELFSDQRLLVTDDTELAQIIIHPNLFDKVRHFRSISPESWIEEPMYIVEFRGFRPRLGEWYSGELSDFIGSIDARIMSPPFNKVLDAYYYSAYAN